MQTISVTTIVICSLKYTIMSQNIWPCSFSYSHALRIRQYFAWKLLIVLRVNYCSKVRVLSYYCLIWNCSGYSWLFVAICRYSKTSKLNHNLPKAPQSSTYYQEWDGGLHCKSIKANVVKIYTYYRAVDKTCQLTSDIFEARYKAIVELL